MNKENDNLSKIFCAKCGAQINKEVKNCPNCGAENPIEKLRVKSINKKKVISILTIFLSLSIIIAILALLIITTIKVNNIEKNISSLSFTTQNGNSENGENDEGIVLANYTFYSDYELENSNLPDGKEYFLYFHSETCPFCLEANKYILSYYNLPTGSESDEYIFDQVPVYFAVADKASELFDKFKIESTPTLIHIVDGEAIGTSVGPEEIYDAINEVVLRYYPQTESK